MREHEEIRDVINSHNANLPPYTSAEETRLEGIIVSHRPANVTAIHHSLLSDDAISASFHFLFSPPFFFFFLFLLLFSLFSFFPPLFHLFPRAIGAFTLIKRPARDVYPGGVSVTSWACRVRWLNKPRQPRGPVGPPFRPTLPTDSAGALSLVALSAWDHVDYLILDRLFFLFVSSVSESHLPSFLPSFLQPGPRVGSSPRFFFFDLRRYVAELYVRLHILAV